MPRPYSPLYSLFSVYLNSQKIYNPKYSFQSSPFSQGRHIFFRIGIAFFGVICYNSLNIYINIHARVCEYAPLNTCESASVCFFCLKNGSLGGQ